MLPHAYRDVLALPRVRTTFLMIFLSRLPLTAVSVSVTLHVTEERGLGYGAAGALAAAWLLGAALGAPRVGRALDRFGARRVVSVCGACSALYWGFAGFLPYAAVLPLGLLAGIVAVPFAALGRQYMAALVPEHQRRPAFCLDMISTEAAFVLGPALAILLASHFSATTALTSIGLWIALASAALVTLGPPVSRGLAGPGARAGERRRRHRPDARVRRTLLMAGGSVFALMGMEIAMYASLRSVGHVHWGGLVMAVMAGASIVGGLVYGCLRRPLPHGALAAMMCVLVLPVGLLGHSWWLLAVALVPANLLCTPALVAATEAITKAAPAGRTGEAMGRYESVTRLGVAAAGPLVGMVIDRTSSGWGFTAAGLGGLALALLAVSPFRSPARASVRSSVRSSVGTTAPPGAA
ncbi:MFS transporter [Streptomyces sp. WAC06614]|uniref:MFS transporter n=1 Tax=Streptomyces sp. WAC06614 TaxID=2487416 RepID=UPI000F78A0F3|nr:MFS transporter [Streptomyces sp. WAC06614]RSS79381.1 MFS transporter [Streptomyces sp. WAC06614]